MMARAPWPSTESSSSPACRSPNSCAGVVVAAKWANTVLGNLKTTLAGAFHALKYRKYADHCLAAFAYRFSRRFDLRDLVARTVVDVARSKPVAVKAVRAHAEARY